MRTTQKSYLYTVAIALLLSFSGCNFIRSTSEHSAIGKSFIHSLLSKDYSACIKMIGIDSASEHGRINIDTLKKTLNNQRNVLVNQFGEKVDISFMSNEQNFTFVGDAKNDTSISKLQLQIENMTQFGVLTFVFKHDKIQGFDAKLITSPVPNLNMFWLFVFFSAIILSFNLYALVKVKRSKLKWKVLYYLLIISCNVPSIGYHCLSGFYFEYGTFDMMIGVAFSKMGYISTYSDFGIPLGAMFSLWMIRRRSNIADDIGVPVEKPVGF